MTLDRLWNGWRAEYVQGGGPSSVGAGSVFTQILESGMSDVETNVVFRGTDCFAILNAFPYATGHVLILPFREVANLEDLTESEGAELWSTTTDAVSAIKSAYRPGGINVGVNLGQPAGGSVSDHVHVHVVPRWTGDSNFMTAIANTRTLPEALDVTADRLRRAWPRIDRTS